MNGGHKKCSGCKEVMKGKHQERIGIGGHPPSTSTA